MRTAKLLYTHAGGPALEPPPPPCGLASRRLLLAILRASPGGDAGQVAIEIRADVAQQGEDAFLAALEHLESVDVHRVAVPPGRNHSPASAVPSARCNNKISSPRSTYTTADSAYIAGAGQLSESSTSFSRRSSLVTRRR